MKNINLLAEPSKSPKSAEYWYNMYKEASVYILVLFVYGTIY